MLSKQIPLGIYEKALPAGECWLERLQLAKTLGFDFVEMSVDETDERLSRLDWSRDQRLALVNAIVETGVRVPSMCLSAHRRFPLGSEDDAVRAQGLEIMRKAIQFAQDVGIRVIQLAGYDVYYQEANNETRRRFRDGLKESVEMASRAQVTLAMEIMDYPLMNSISKALGYAHYLNNPWFQLYPDIGNLSAWDNDVQMELQAGIGHIVAVHVKDTKPGVFKNVPFGEGVVDFERCFETLKQSGYCGPYLIEMWSETAEDPAAEVAKARDWVKARMAKAGMVVVDMSGKVVEGEYRPSSDTATHLELYRRYPSLGGIVHTHSTHATAWAQAGLAIPALGTTHADYFFGDIPCTRGLSEEEVQGEYELNTGKVIIETLGNAEPLHTPGIVVYQHGPFAWGKDAHDAVHNAVVMEEVAKMAWIARSINPQLNHIDSFLMNKHFMRKHGPNAYYGQK
ncbi:L-ribulose-5-phosphate 3-epimerase [Escherichia coli]|nr:L-ribulose-5-phosphate 3-epimerase [Escherichia coli]